MSDNPFFEPSTLVYELPPFTAIREEHYLPAFERGMADQLAEIAAITADPQAPTFDNTLVALERSGALLRRVSAVFLNQSSADTNDLVDAVDAEISPRLAAHQDAIHLDAALFARIEALHERRDSLGLDAQSLRLLERHHTRFVRAGARLGAAEQARLRELNSELASAATAFQQNVAADTRARALVLDSAEQLDGLSADAVAAAAENGRALGHDGRYVLSLKNFSNQSELAQLTDRSVRERLLAASLGRAVATNGPLAIRMAGLRAERAALLGHPSHAAYVVEDETAGTVEAVDALLARLVPPAVANAGREAAELAKLAAADGIEEIAAHDWAFYSERVRRSSYQVDAAVLRPYFELERVLHDGVFFAANLAYGLTFTERPDLVGYHPDARVFEVFEEDGGSLGLFIGDFHARASKRGGAWMDELVSQSTLLDKRPVVLNNLNIARPAPGEPVLLTWDEVRTLFHEFGHALHGLFSAVRFPLFSGTEVPRDFVEFPSQVNEMWMTWPAVLANYAKHHVTGEPLPADLVERMTAAEGFGQGFRTVEYLAAALLDWAWHTVPVGLEIADAQEFEARALAEAGLAVAAIPPRYRSTYFNHIFASGYSAGYYAYIWSEVLDAETVEWFRTNGRTVRESGEVFRAELLSRGGSVDALECFRAVVGRDPRTGPLLARRGLA
ncbi:peptidyl-dipeptidase Dcp [Kitasatospora herbaricolor]|uniref:M3 family metallopeptidase n=1 Tax=Kitasatospora herbaricolor TaxID=68217 RepID=UPI00174DD75F|nr:M3 family metallopeptidase [Kitasatospora herbaricolor]MDQ0310961.1 peptidyl-dipeptidase Dcp [Kitasatospora herbaricolor]GGV31845.1 peptidyl-dipeptidase Dcp [Kitasatospora herbaricolor]